MSVSYTTRLSLVRWSANGDQYSRDQIDASFASLEDSALKWGKRESGDAARPAVSTTWNGALFYDKENGTLSYADADAPNAAWIDLLLLGVTSPASTNVMLGEGANIVTGTTTGTKIGTSTSQKLGFYNATPVVRQANTVQSRVALQTYGLLASGGEAMWEVRTIASGTARPSPGALGEAIWEERTQSLLFSTGAAWVGVTPCGTISAFYGTTAPAGWLFCDGSTFNATTYAELNTLLGGNTLPDLRDKTIMGRTTTGAAYSTTGQASIPATILFAFTPDSVTSAPGGSDVQAKALTNAGSTDNAPASAKLNYIIKA